MEWDDVCADLIIHHFMAALCHRLNAGRAEQRAGLNPLRGIINCVAELDVLDVMTGRRRAGK